LESNPGEINLAAETTGWLFKISVKNPSQVESLLTEEKYKEHCENESH
jgi:glycine cleavage system H protein